MRKLRLANLSTTFLKKSQIHARFSSSLIGINGDKSTVLKESSAYHTPDFKDVTEEAINSRAMLPLPGGVLRFSLSVKRNFVLQPAKTVREHSPVYAGVKHFSSVV